MPRSNHHQKQEELINTTTTLSPSLACNSSSLSPSLCLCRERYRNRNRILVTQGALGFRCSTMLQLFYNTFLHSLGLYFLFYDVARGIGSSNGRFTSFVQSVESAYKYKAGHYDVSNKNIGRKTVYKLTLKYIYRCIVSTFLKFGPGTVVSIALGLYPTWTKGPRHIYSYYIAFCVIQLLPRNTGFLLIHENRFSRFLMHTATALYKLRKLIFIFHASSGGIYIVNKLFYGSSSTRADATALWYVATQVCIFLLALWECEGSTLSRQIELAISKSGDGQGNRCHRPLLHYLSIIFKTTYSYISGFLAVFTRCCSLVAVWMLYFACRDSDKNGGFNNDRAKVLPFHVKLLAFAFLWLRYNVNDVLKLIHKCIHRQRESKYSRSLQGSRKVKKH